MKQLKLKLLAIKKLENNERYQTVWSEIEWSVAAPTASLHFTDELIEKIKEIIIKRIECINIYLKYKNCTHSTERHIYVVNIYKEFLS